MGADPPVIDLGVLGAPGQPAAAQPGAARPPAGGVRTTAVAILAGLAALLGGSAPPPPERIPQVATIGVANVRSYSLGDGLLYTLDQTADGAPADTLTAYRLADGARRWSVPVDPGTFDAQVWPDDGLLVAVAADERTTAFDPATGARRWQARGGFAGTVAGFALLISRNVPDGERLAVADPVTGAVRWFLDLPELGSTAYDDAGQVAVLDSAGTVVVRRLADGAELRRGRLDRQVRRHDPTAQTELRSADGLLTVTETDEDGITVSTYRADTFALLWRRTVHADAVNPCGALLCVSDGTTLTAVDPRTGHPRWVSRGWRWTGSSVQGRLLGNAGDDENPYWGLVDPATGRTVGDYGAVTLVHAADWLILRREHVPGRRLVLGARTVVSRLGTAGGPDTLLGTVSGVVWQDCRGAGPYLVCPTVLGALTVHRLDGAH
jgi:outer membrane protein assembly factor BamB